MDNQNVINEIRSKIDIVDLVSNYVSLTKKGQYYWGICPFHNDKNPSMSVDPRRQTVGVAIIVVMSLTFMNKLKMFHLEKHLKHLEIKQV